ncbi:MAG: hypothetical protein J6R47_00715 [Acholeplasmatales bacterium]|nr:hypothetical protein [Acholeplasmatales bacterium]
MPIINISETDLTKATGTVSTDVVFIPGMSLKVFREISDGEIGTYKYNETSGSYVEATTGATHKMVTPFNVPTLCNSVSEFEYYFGTTPLQFKHDYDYYDIKADDYDRSFIMAKELLAKGMPVYYYAIDVNAYNVDDTEKKAITAFFEELKRYLDTADLEDKNEYTFKYLTTGGYSNYDDAATADAFHVANRLIAIASNRGDCLALIEGRKAQTVDPNSSASLWKKLCSDTSIADGDEYAAAFTPWAYYALSGTYELPTKTNKILMPACYAYLIDLAVNVKTSPNWLAMAGTTRGIVPNIIELATDIRLSNVIADTYQPTKALGDTTRAVNAITNIKPYGLTIWGNRTLKTIDTKGLTGTNFLNTRNMISDIKKVAFAAAKAQLFEQNSEVLWLNFKSEVSPFLEQLKKGNGISDYKLLKLNTKYNGNSLGKEEFACVIKIYPLYAIESFEITVEVSDNEVAVG